jgi:hypothetical protein
VGLPPLRPAGDDGWAATGAAVVAGVGRVTLATATVFGMVAGASAALVAHSPLWLAVGSVADLVTGSIVERWHGPKQ